jgi:hypothetical protein
MRPKLNELWNLRRLPARLNAEEAGALLGFTADGICWLAVKKLLPSIGSPALGGQFWFAAVEIEPLCADAKWLAKATKAVRDYNKARNERQQLDAKNKIATGASS